MNLTRREFTKRIGALGVGSWVALPGTSVRGSADTPSPLPTEATPTGGRTSLRRLGKTGLTLSSVGFGAQRTRDADLIRYALDRGINHIETAWGYGWGLPGNSCECVGKAIAGKRDGVCLAVAYDAGAPRESKQWVSYQFEQTLRDLRTDHIDVFLWHQPEVTVGDREWSVEENQALIAGGDLVDRMLQWKEEGKVRCCGVTTHREQAGWLAFVTASRLYEVAVVAFNNQSAPPIATAMQEAAQEGIGLIAMKTQSPHYLEAPGTIGDAADHREALNWVLAKEYIAAAIPGMTTRSQVDLNLETMSLTAVPILHAERDAAGKVALWWEDPGSEFEVEWTRDPVQGEWRSLLENPEFREGNQWVRIAAVWERQYFRLRRRVEDA